MRMGGTEGDGKADGPEGMGVPGRFTRAELVEQLTNPEQQQLLRKMMAAFAGPEETEEEDGRGLYRDAGCLLRYLRARKWDLEAAKEMLRNTGRWRKSFDFAGLVAGKYKEVVARENISGKMFVRGYDKRGRPALYMRPRHEFSTDSEAVIRHLVYCVERAVRCVERRFSEGKVHYEPTDPQVGKFVLLIDFGDFGLRNAIPLSVARETITILQDHYPERLGQAFIVDAPWIFLTFWNAVKVFIDPVTMEKLQWVTEEGKERAQRFEKTFDLAELEPAFGGTATEPFQSHIFMKGGTGVTEFGYEFNEQLRLFGPENGKATQEVGEEVPLLQSVSFWGVSSDERVLALTREERSLVRELARLLACQVDNTLEEYAGLFDDAGALIRYLRAEAWQPPQAEKRIRATARWRKEFSFSAQRAGAFSEAIARESASEKMYVRGFDRRGRPIVYVKLQHADSRRHEETLRYFVYCLERAVACAELERRLAFPPKAEQVDGKVVVLIDFARYSCRHRPKLRTIRGAISILEDHYPERLGDIYLLRPPLKVRLFWSMVRQAVPASTYQKVAIISNAKQHAELIGTVFDKSALETCVGGELDAPFSSNVFLRRQVNGTLYGVEFEAQLHARENGRRVLWADDMNLPLKEVDDEGVEGWGFSLDGFFGTSGGGSS